MKLIEHRNSKRSTTKELIAIDDWKCTSRGAGFVWIREGDVSIGLSEMKFDTDVEKQSTYSIHFTESELDALIPELTEQLANLRHLKQMNK